MPQNLDPKSDKSIKISGPGVPASLTQIDFTYARNVIKQGKALAPVLALNVVEYVRHSVRLEQKFSQSLAAFAYNLISGRYDGCNGRLNQPISGKYDEKLLSNKELLKKLVSVKIPNLADQALSNAVVAENPAQKYAKKLEYDYPAKEKPSKKLEDFVSDIIKAIKSKNLDEAVMISCGAIAEYQTSHEVLYIASSSYYYRAVANIYSGANKKKKENLIERENDLKSAKFLCEYSVLLSNEVGDYKIHTAAIKRIDEINQLISKITNSK